MYAKALMNKTAAYSPIRKYGPPRVLAPSQMSGFRNKPLGLGQGLALSFMQGGLDPLMAKLAPFLNIFTGRQPTSQRYKPNSYPGVDYQPMTSPNSTRVA